MNSTEDNQKNHLTDLSQEDVDMNSAEEQSEETKNITADEEYIPDEETTEEEYIPEEGTQEEEYIPEEETQEEEYIPEEETQEEEYIPEEETQEEEYIPQEEMPEEPGYTNTFYPEYEEEEQPVKKFRISRVFLCTGAALAAALVIYLVLLMIPNDGVSVDTFLPDETEAETETETEILQETELEEETEETAVNPVPMPDIDEQLLTINDWSRPGKKTDKIEYIVIHYLGNPQTTAQQNHDYFESLKKQTGEDNDPGNVSMSANFIVGLDGEIIECVPPGEVAYASNSYNSKSISIENCHLDESGRFTVDTYNSLVHLTAWLVCEYNLDRDHIIRHYDVTGKECPIYYVENPDKWEDFRDDVMNYIEECREAAEND